MRKRDRQSGTVLFFLGAIVIAFSTGALLGGYMWGAMLKYDAENIGAGHYVQVEPGSSRTVWEWRSCDD